ncbi:outer membrane protein [Dysgonomonas alginatilytica]|uniref:Outer membrane protein n=1 Tax=Dysgonomonas alginatilytica TaxID=1605892 RepID=A0A2V3PU03_9BACT|nr:TolC family protein [Dysgonomonas alginatilytica]PXV68062.1 outer membrane protein [Dysgonomonas alginatilytica]
MKKYIIAVSCLLLSFSMQSQSAWDLRKCIDYAIEHNIEIMQQGLQVKGAEVDLNTSKNARLPDLTGAADQSFSFGQTRNVTSGIYESKTASITNFSFATNTPIFTGFRIQNQIKANELSLYAAMAGLDKAKENMELQITSYFLEVLFKKEILKVFKEQVYLTQKQVDRTSILVETGKVAESQLYDIKAQLAKDELNVTTSENDLQLSLLNLSQALNLQTFEGFDIEAPKLTETLMVEDVLAGLVKPDAVYDQAVQTRPHVKEAQFNVESSMKALKVAQAGYWPTLSFGASYGNGFSHVYDSSITQLSIGSQLRGNYRIALGLNLNIPIFDRFDTRNKVRQARLTIENQQLILENVKLALFKEIQQAYQNATASQAKFISTERAYEAAAESFKYAEERYQIGKTSVFEYNEAQTKLITTKSEQIQAKYDFVFRSKILDFYQGREITM